MISEDRLKNWGWWCAFGPLGPEVRSQCASAEGNYESEDVLSVMSYYKAAFGKEANTPWDCMMEPVLQAE